MTVPKLTINIPRGPATEPHPCGNTDPHPVHIVYAVPKRTHLAGLYPCPGVPDLDVEKMARRLHAAMFEVGDGADIRVASQGKILGVLRAELARAGLVPLPDEPDDGTVLRSKDGSGEWARHDGWKTSDGKARWYATHISGTFTWEQANGQGPDGVYGGDQPDVTAPLVQLPALDSEVLDALTDRVNVHRTCAANVLTELVRGRL
jgi:hypothetical protein